MVKKQLNQLLERESIPFQPGETRKKLEAKCVANGLPITYHEPRVIEGWVGKAKGSLQVLYE